MNEQQYKILREKRNKLRDKYLKAGFLESSKLLKEIKVIDMQLSEYEKINNTQ